MNSRKTLALILALIMTISAAQGLCAGVYTDAQLTYEYTPLTADQKAELPLINAAHPLPDDFALPRIQGRAAGEYDVVDSFSPLVNLFEQRHSFRLASSDIWLCRHVYEAMERMFAQAEAEDMNGFIITSGWRSRERQQELYDQLESGIAALPGCSEHETGLSFDVTAYSDGDFGSTPQYKWLVNHCWDYGFILRYPAGTSDITGITGESWHFRYVGRDAACEILALGVTLEEYLDGIDLKPVSSAGVNAAFAAGATQSASATMRPADASATDAWTEPTATPVITPEPTPMLTATPTDAPAFDLHEFITEDGIMQFIDPTYAPVDGHEFIYLAGGCFWGMEKLMQSLNGVVDAVSGYANGEAVSPSYKEVKSGLTGHRETVRVEYDPNIITLEQLLYAYFEVVDPELVNRQGHDIGTQYQAGIYYITAESGRVVEAYADQKRAEYPNFAVEIEPLRCFYSAEEYHQDYLDKNPGGYCHIPLATITRIAAELNGN